MVFKKLIFFDYFFKIINIYSGYLNILNVCIVVFILNIFNFNFLNIRYNVYLFIEMCIVIVFLFIVRVYRVKLWVDFILGMDLMLFKI